MPLPPQWRWKLDRIRDRLAALFGSSKPEDARPKLCPACGTLVGATATKCHQCGTSMTYSLAAASRSLSSMLPGESPVTYIILAVNFLLFAVTIAASAQAGGGFGSVSGEVLGRLGMRWTLAIINGDWFRLVTPIFLHAGIMHFLMNSFSMIQLGPMIEDVYGSARYLFLYVVTGTIGFLFTTIWNIVRGIDGTSIGASGSLMGLVGLALAITSRRGGAYFRMVRTQLISSVVLIFVMGIILPFIDNFAHFGGLASGFLLGRVFNDSEPANGPERKRAYLLGLIGALMIIASFGALLLRHIQAGTIKFGF